MHKTQRPLLQIIKELQEFVVQSELSQSEIARRAAVNQSTVHRLMYMGEKRKRLSIGLYKLCEYAKVDVQLDIKNVDPTKSKELMDALEFVWDGSIYHAKLLANLIRDIGSLSQTN